MAWPGWRSEEAAVAPLIEPFWSRYPVTISMSQVMPEAARKRIHYDEEKHRRIACKKLHHLSSPCGKIRREERKTTGAKRWDRGSEMECRPLQEMDDLSFPVPVPFLLILNAPSGGFKILDLEKTWSRFKMLWYFGSKNWYRWSPHEVNEDKNGHGSRSYFSPKFNVKPSLFANADWERISNKSLENINYHLSGLGGFYLPFRLFDSSSFGVHWGL